MFEHLQKDHKKKHSNNLTNTRAVQNTILGNRIHTERGRAEAQLDLDVVRSLQQWVGGPWGSSTLLAAILQPQLLRSLPRLLVTAARAA